MDKQKYNKYALFVFFAMLVMLAFIVLMPFMTVILTGALIAYIFYPFFRFLNRRIHSRNICAFIALMSIILVFGFTLTFISEEVFKEASSMMMSPGFDMNYISGQGCFDQSTLCEVSNLAYNTIKNPTVQEIVISFANNVSKSLLFSIPSFLLKLLVFVFVTFYFFRDGDKVGKYIDMALPFKDAFKKKLKKNTEDVMNSTIFGAIVLSIIQGLLGTIALILFDSTKSPLFWGIIMAIASIIPFFGTSIIWLPFGAVQILNGYFQGSHSLMWKGIGLIIFGALLVSTIDNILRPYIVGNRARIHPLLVLLGALGGLSVMGVMGIFLGPIILATLISFIRVYRNENI